MMIVPSVRCLLRLASFGFALGLSGAISRAQTVTPSAADGYTPDFDGNVYVMAVQADGRVIVGGQFANYRSADGFTHRRRNLARLNVDGTLDESFDPEADAPVRAILIQPDGRILVGGDFTTLQPNGAASATTRNRIVRLNADGSIDAGFDPNLGGFLQPQVTAIVRQSDGRIVVGGSFTTAQPNGVTVPFTRNYLARFNPDGSLDQGYDPHPNGPVLALALHLDDKLVVGGGFTSFWEAGKSDPSNRFRLARLNTDGSLDSEFNLEANNGVTSLVAQRDGKIIVGGYFTTFKHVTEDGVNNRNYLARLNPDGSVDSEFYPLVNGSVMSIALAPDGGFLVGGNFTSAWSRGTTTLARNSVAKFHPDGTLDSVFNPGVNGVVDAYAFQPDGKFVLGGYFTRVQPAGLASGLVRNHVARFNSDGTLDTHFQLAEGGRVLTSVVQTDGRIVIGGSFTNVGGVTHNYAARLNADGSVDSTYAPDFDGRVYSMALQSDGKVIVGGAFTTIGGEPRNHIARLNPIGTIDSEFNPNIDGQVGVVLLQPDGKILVGGTFTKVQPLGYADAVTRSNLLRLNADGSLDSTFDPYANSTVTALALQSDNKLLVGGLFNTFTPGYTANNSAKIYTQGYFARLNADGTLDTDFKPTLNAQVSAVALQSDGKIVISGTFTTVTGADGKLVTKTNTDGTTSDVAPTRNHIARLQSDGKLDFAFDPNANGNVLALSVQADGKIVVGGAFTTFAPFASPDWILRKYVARLNPDSSVDAAFNLDVSEESGNRVDLLRLQSDGKLLLGGNFTSLQPIGSATRVARKNFVRLDPGGQVDTGFDPGVAGSSGGAINALAVQANNKVIAVGDFSDLGGAKTTNIARFRPEGTPDSTFGTTLAADGPINAVIVRPAGTATPSQLTGFAWLQRDGALRAGFAPGGPARFSGQINAVAIERDGSLLLGGSFSDLSNNYTGNLARFHVDGTLDTKFQPNLSGAVTAIAVQSDGRLVVAGAFTTVNGTARNHLARIDADGALDITFDPAPNAQVDAVLIQDDGSIVVGGSFTKFTLGSADGTSGDTATTTAEAADDVTRNYLARINVNGTIDADYYPTPNGAVNALAFQADGKVIAGGVFTTLQPNGGATSFTRNYIARINLDGTLDQNFNPSANGAIYTIVTEPDGQIDVGGAFTTFQPFLGDSVITRNHVARINSDATLDLTFDPNANDVVRSIALQADGALLLGGAFTTLRPNGVTDAVTRNYLARVNADGTLDLDFNPDVNAGVLSVTALPDGSALIGGTFTGLQPNGSLLVGGSFATLGGIPARNLAMLNDGGSVNTSFRPQPDGAVRALLALDDGRMLVGGAFTNIGGVARNRFARFNADGTLDSGFNPNANGTINAIAVQSDGKVIAGGAFTAIGGQTRANLARLTLTGAIDSTFAAATSGDVTALAIQADGKILYVASVSGGRSTVGRLNADGSPDGSALLTTAAGAIRSLALETDGRIMVGGTFSGLGSTSVARVARITSGFVVDRSYVPAPNGAITALALQADGRVMVGGNFSTIGGQARYGIARLAATDGAAQTLGVTSDRSTVVLVRTGAAAEIAGALFERSSDGHEWEAIGRGVRIGRTSDWELGSLALPSSGLFYIRARPIALGSSGVSSGLYETAREFTYSNPLPNPGTNVGQTIAGIDAFTGVVSAQLAQEAAAAWSGVGSSDPGASPADGGNGGGSTVASRLADLAIQSRVTAAEPLITGFAISGTLSRAILVRAVGPGLAPFGVQGTLATPQLRLYNSAGAQLLSNSGWGGGPTLSAAFAQVGAFALSPGSTDAAALVTLAPGAYSVQITDAGTSGGTALAEVYDAGSVASADGGRLINLSCRGVVRADAPFIGGLVVSGSVTKRLLVRGVGPSLAKFGVSGIITDPMVTVFDSRGRQLATNNDWGTATELSAAAVQVGAFALDAGSKDAALIVGVGAGAYTVQVGGANSATGTALLEIYELP